MDIKRLEKLLDDIANSIPIDPKTGLRIYNPEGVMEVQPRYPNHEPPRDFVTEASDLGWKPDEVRTHIIHNEERYEYSRTTKREDGETVSWHYVSSTGKTITVFND